MAIYANFPDMGPDRPRNPLYRSYFPATTSDGIAKTVAISNVVTNNPYTVRPGRGVTERAPISKYQIDLDLSGRRVYDVNRRSIPTRL